MLSEQLHKSKYLSRDFWQPLIVPAIVVLVGLASFALGRLSALAQPIDGSNAGIVGQ